MSRIVIHHANPFPALKSPQTGAGLSGVISSSPYLEHIKLDIGVRVRTCAPVVDRSMVWVSGRRVVRTKCRQQWHLGR